jgi:hypothetical protein
LVHTVAGRDESFNTMTTAGQTLSINPVDCVDLRTGQVD